MTLIDSQLVEVSKIIRPEVPLPVILEVERDAGPARVREVESFGVVARYSGKLVPQIHGDVVNQEIGNLAKSGAAKTVWYDAPMYAATHTRSPLRSTPEEIAARVKRRVEAAGSAPPPSAHSHLRTFLGVRGPQSLKHSAAILGLDDVRRFTRSSEVWDKGVTGKGVLVAVLDTGVDGTHPMLDGVVKEHLSFVPEPAGFDGQGHGSWCASCIAGKPFEYHGRVDKKNGAVLQGMSEADLLSVKVLTSEGSGETSGVIQGIEAAVAKGARVLNMSLGGLFGEAGLGPDAMAVNAATELGVNVVVASGNSFGYATVGTPGSAAGAITVGAVAMKTPAEGVVSSFSSKGPTSAGRIKPDVAAPGGNTGGDALDESILGATAGALAAQSGEGFALLRGTSMATPAMAGIVAQAVQVGFPKDRELVEGALSVAVRTGRPLAGVLPIKNNRVGWGVLDAVRLMEAVQNPKRIPIRGAAARVQGGSRPILGRLAAGLETVRGFRAPTSERVRIGLV